MTSQITKLVLVPLEEWKRLNKNGEGNTYTTIEIPSSEPRNQEGRGIKQEEKEELNRPPPPPPSPISHCPTLQGDEKLGGPLPPLPPPLLPPLPSPPPPPWREEEKGERRKEEGRKEGELKLSEMLVIDLLEKEF